MSPTTRQRLALVVMVVAGLASLATSVPSPPSDRARERVRLTADAPTDSRRVAVLLFSAAARGTSTVDASIQVDRSAAEAGDRVIVSVIRERDGAVVGEETDPRDRLHHAGRVTLHRFSAIDACAPETTCEETFIVTFARASDDPDAALHLTWRLVAEVETESGNAAPGATISVEILEKPKGPDGP